MVFFIADTHFGHKNVLKLYDRPFETIRWFSCFITQESFIWFRLFLFPKKQKGGNNIAFFVLFQKQRVSYIIE